MMCAVCGLTAEQDSTDAFGGDSWRGPDQPGTAKSTERINAKSHHHLLFVSALICCCHMIIDAF